MCSSAAWPCGCRAVLAQVHPRFRTSDPHVFPYDSTSYEATDLGSDCDLIGWGFPCQVWSKLHRGATDQEMRRSLEVLRQALRYFRPLGRAPRRYSLFILENVPNLRSPSLGWALAEIMEMLSAVGRPSHRVLCPTEFGSCASRPRLYFMVLPLR